MSADPPPEWAKQAVEKIAATLAALVLPKLPEEHRAAPFQPTIVNDTRNKIPRLAGIIMDLMPPDPATAMLDEIRRWLKSGASISATDPAGEVLVLQEDGRWHGGITVDGAIVPQSTLDPHAVVHCAIPPAESCREAIVRTRKLFVASEKAKLIAALLTSGKPMRFKEVAVALEIPHYEVKTIIQESGSGLKIIQGGWVKLDVVS